MNKKLSIFTTNKSVQLFVYFIINSLFILKYVPRTGLNSYFVLPLYFAVFFLVYFILQKYILPSTEKKIRILYWLLIFVALITILVILHIVNPFNLRIDRWSALSFFWDSLLQGHYPYGAHTHLRINSFPSAFPLWLYIIFPFYLMGDVGYELLFFLIITALAVRYFYGSYQKSFIFIFLLLISPAYWYEISVRSDSLSNGLFAFIIILWLIKTNRTLANSFILSILVCGAVASTRFSAIIPIALFLLQPYMKLSLKRKIIFPVSIIGIAFLLLSPFIFWDTTTWVFLTRNPFIAQTGNGNIYFLVLMIIIGLFMALRWKNTNQLFNCISIFMFIFMLGSQFVSLISAGQYNLFSDSISDISYLNLALPYCLIYLSASLNSREIKSTDQSLSQ